MKKTPQRHTMKKAPLPEVGGGIVSRRNFLRATGAAATLALLPKGIEVAGAVGDALTTSEAERQEIAQRREQRREQRQAAADQKLRAQYEREDRDKIAAAIWHNQAKPIKEFSTDSGISVNVMQAQTGWNNEVPLDVDVEAMNASINFLIGAMGSINEVNGSPIDPERIRALQEKAHNGELTNVQLTVIASATTGYHGPDGVQGGGGSAFNGHPHRGDDVRENILPLVFFAPHIYSPGTEVLTPSPSVGVFPDEPATGLETITPTPAQYFSTHFGHEFSHVLVDILGSDVMIDQMDGIHSAPQMEHKTFVTPLNWYHTAALAGRAEGQPLLAPSFIVPEIH